VDRALKYPLILTMKKDKSLEWQRKWAIDNDVLKEK